MEKVANVKSKCTANKTSGSSSDTSIEELWKEFLGNPAVMWNAYRRFAFATDGYLRIQPKGFEFSTIGRCIAVKRAWDAMPDTEKAHFITQSLHHMYRHAKEWMIEEKVKKIKNIKESKASIKRNKEIIEAVAQDLFWEDCFETLIKENPNDDLHQLPDEVVYHKWGKLTQEDKADYFAKAEEFQNGLVSLYKRLLLTKKVYKQLGFGY